MASTNFAALTDEQLTTWSRDFWREARNRTFLMPFVGSDHMSMIQRVDELKTTNDGARAVLTLIHESAGDGVVGDNQLKGNESVMTSDECVLRLDQWRDAHRSTGKLNEQTSVVKFRNEAKLSLANKAARVMDELMFLTMSGVAYTRHTNGATRTGSQLNLLSYAADVTAPTSARHYRWDATTGLMAGDTTAMVDADTPTWAMLVQAKAKAVEDYLPALSHEGGIEYYNVFMSPRGIALLKQDPNFLAAWQHAQKRGEDNPLFKGTPHGGRKGIYIDGLNILEYRHVYNTLGAVGASAANQWTNLTRGGQRTLLCGRQALGYADIKGALPTWVEETEDLGNIDIIATGKIFGLLKPKFLSSYAGSVQDFGVMCIDTAL